MEGGTHEQQKTFYSCLYRTLLFPREFYEFDSDNKPVYYSPYDGQLHGGYMYTDNGFWDTFRAVHPLFTLAYPEVSGRIMQSLVNAYDESGFMPEWASPGHRGCMIGNNSISLLTDAWMKGIRTFDKDKALEAMLHQTQARGEIASVGRDGYEEYDRLGYVPYPEVPEATAKTLEYAYADWCLARFAEATGNQEIAKAYYKRHRTIAICFIPKKVSCGQGMPMASGVITLTPPSGEDLSLKAVPGIGLGVYSMIRKVCLRFWGGMNKWQNDLIPCLRLLTPLIMVLMVLLFMR